LPLNGLFRPLEHIESDPKRALVYCLPQGRATRVDLRAG
jgi:hypothetical protein